MSSRFWWQGLHAASIVLICSVLVGTALAAQAPRPGARNNEIASDPIKCSWKTDKGAVQIGEQFMLTLTCRVIETSGLTVIPKMEQLDPGAVQITPFELVSGTRHDDIQSPPWRYFQYDYTVRLIGQDFFGTDVDIPPLTVTYNIKSEVAGVTAGRDRMYVLPALPIRIMSLVPKKANDIRDTTGESFAAATARLSRATTEFISAGIFFAFAVLMLAFAVVHVVRRNRESAPARPPVISQAALIRACVREIGRLRSEVTGAGWTAERTCSALTVLRIGSAVAMGRPVAQTPMAMAVPAREGQLAVRKGILARENLVVSAPITSDVIKRYRVNSNGQAPNVRTQAIIDDLGKSLAAFSAVRYGREGSLDPAGLNRALESGRTALQRLRVATLWPMRTAGALRSSMWTR